ncbi:MAG: rhodanese-like domain-containing protein [bacterium]|nr:rhodanese-like domain-containing protein [bacterium]
MLYLLFNTPAHARVIDVDADGLLALQAAGAPVIDIRREDEWEMTGIIPGSLLLTFFDEYRRYDLDTWLAAFDRVADRNQPFVLVCRNGVRTRRLGRYLHGVCGWTGVHHLAGGLRPWAESGRPMDLPPDPAEAPSDRT